jgi:hypothetical protein
MDTPANLCRPPARWLLASSAGVCWCGMFPTPDRIASWSRSPPSRRRHDDQHIKTHALARSAGCPPMELLAQRLGSLVDKANADPVSEG